MSRNLTTTVCIEAEAQRATVHLGTTCLGLHYLIMHPGAHLDSGEETGLARVAAALDEIHSRSARCRVRVLLVRLLVNDPRFRNRPMILETPKEDGKESDMDAFNLAVLRGLLGQDENESGPSSLGENDSTEA